MDKVVLEHSLLLLTEDLNAMRRLLYTGATHVMTGFQSQAELGHGKRESKYRLARFCQALFVRARVMQR